MDFKEVIGHYKKISLNFNNLKLSTKKEYKKDNVYYANLNNNLYNLFVEVHHIDGKYNFNVFSKGYIDENGIFMDLNAVKNNILSIFNIDPSNAKEELEELLNKDHSYYRNLVESDPSLMAVIKNIYEYDIYYKNIKHPERHKNKIINKHCRLLRNRVKLALDLIENDQEYVKVNEDVFDEGKFKLYIAYKVIKYSKTLNEEDERYKKCIEYLKKYVRENYYLKTKFGDYDIKYVEDFVSEIRKKENKESKNMVNKELDLDSKATIEYDFDFFDFESLPKEEVVTRLQGILRTNPRYINYEEVLERKIALYKELPFTKVLKGKNKFDGYLGFVIDDKYVILDKFYNADRSRHVSVGNAIYIVSKNDFEILVKHSKSDAIDLISLGLIDAVRINHTGDYETRVKNYIKYGTKYVDANKKEKIKNKGSLDD